MSHALPIHLFMAGVELGDGRNRSAEIGRAWQQVTSYGGSVGAAYPTIAMPALYVPSGRWTAPGGIFSSELTGVTIFGDGMSSVLDGVEVHIGGNFWSVHDLALVDSRGIQAGTKGLRFWGHQATSTGVRDLVSNVRVRDKDIGVSMEGYVESLTGAGGAFFNIANMIVENCNTGFSNSGETGAHLANCEFLNCLTKGVDCTVGNEVKLSNCRILGTGAAGSGAIGLHIHGTTVKTVLEPYFNEVTCTLTGARQIPILSVADNGSGFARFTTSATLTVDSIVDGGIVLWRGEAGGEIGAGASTALSIQNTSTGGQITQITVNGNNLLSAPVAWNTNNITTGNALAAAVNSGPMAGTYAAAMPFNNGRVYISAQLSLGAAANGQAVVITTTAGFTLTTNGFSQVHTTTAHGYAAGTDVEITTSGAYIGIAAVEFVVDANTFLIYQNFVAGAYVGTVCVPNRLVGGSNGLTGLTISGTANYNPPYSQSPTAVSTAVTACTSSTFDTNIPFVGTDTGTASIAGWDVVIDAQDTEIRTSDVFFTGGNINYTLIKSAYKVHFIGTRLKSQIWIDFRLNTALRANMVEIVGNLGRLNIANSNLQVLPSGTATGWAMIGQFDFSGGSSAGNAETGMIVPLKTAGTTNGQATTLSKITMPENGTPNLSNVQSTTPPVGTVANSLTIQYGASGSRVGLIQTGESTTGLYLQTAGTGSLDFNPGGQRSFRVTYSSGTIANWVEAVGGTAGNPASLVAAGSDADIDLSLSPKGAGLMKFGTRTVLGAEVLSGYITVKDSGGTTRKLAVIS